jgi:hypothetical protein
MKYFLAILLLLLAFDAEAVTRYADDTIAAGPCSNYSPATRLCSGGSDTAYGTTNALRNAIVGLGANDTVNVRTGTYAAVGYGHQGGTQFPSGSALGFLTIQGYLTERPTIRGFDFNGNSVPSTYVKLVNFTVNCNAVLDSIGVVAIHFSRMENVEVTNCGGGGLNNIGNSTLLNLDVWNNGFNCSAPVGQ